MVKLRWAVPILVAREKLPRAWLAKLKEPSPPTVVLTTVRLPRLVLVKVQVTRSPASRQTAAGLDPSEQVAPVRDYVWEPEEDGIRMRFSLFKGCYATAYLREFMKANMLNY